jgi:hypothetical protein
LSNQGSPEILGNKELEAESRELDASQATGVRRPVVVVLGHRRVLERVLIVGVEEVLDCRSGRVGRSDPVAIVGASALVVVGDGPVLVVPDEPELLKEVEVKGKRSQRTKTPRRREKTSVPPSSLLEIRVGSAGSEEVPSTGIEHRLRKTDVMGV